MPRHRGRIARSYGTTPQKTEKEDTCRFAKTPLYTDIFLGTPAMTRCFNILYLYTTKLRV